MLPGAGALLFLQSHGQTLQRIPGRRIYRRNQKNEGNGGAAHSQTFFYLLSQLTEAENKLLAAPATILEKKAGISAFAEFKYINTINSLAGGDITKWDTILAMPYERVLTKLLLNKTEAAYQKRYSELLEAQR
jgi:hypothetical protein